MLTVILAAPGTVVAGVRGVLRDWSAVGLIEPYAWVSAASARTAAYPLAARTSVVQGGVASASSLNDHLADQQRLDGVRLCVLTELGDADRLGLGAQGNDLRNSLSTSGVRVTATHMVTAQRDDRGLVDDDLWLGWHNVLVSPEDSPAPAQGRLAKLFTSPDQAYVRHVGANVAALGGLWIGMGGGPLDDRQPSGTRQIAVARAFMRTVDAREVETEVRTALSDLSGGLPRPVRDGRTHVYFDDPPAAAAEMASTVMGQRLDGEWVHRPLFEHRSVERTTASAERIGGAKLLGMFVSFVGASLRAAPGRWVSGVVDSTSAAAARGVSDAVFAGQENRFEVVVNGLTASGGRADTPQLRAAIEQWEVGAGQARRPLPPLPPTQQFWEAVAGGALTLLDGDDHGAGLSPPRSAGQPAVMRRPSDIAPPAGAVHGFAPDAAAVTGVTQIAAADVLAQRAALSRLDAAVAVPGPEASRLSTSRESLRQLLHRAPQTYLGAIGARLADEVTASDVRVKQLADRLWRFRETRRERGGIEAAAGGVALAVQITTALLVVVLVGLVAAGATDVLAWDWTAALAGTAVVVWALVTAIVVWTLMIDRFRDEFARLHAREQDEASASALAADFRVALYEKRRHLTLYSQYLAWSQVIGSFVHAPLGRVAAAGATRLRLGGDLPRSVRLGRARTDAARIDEAVRSLRARLFQPGWAAALWDDRVSGAITDMRRAGIPVDRRDVLFGADPLAEDSPLRAWAEANRLDPTAVGSDGAIWHNARRTIFSGRTGADQQDFVSRVEVVAHDDGGGSGTTGDAFVGDLVRAAIAPRTFAPDIFSGSGRVGGRSHVVRTHLYTDQSGVQPAFDGAGSEAHQVSVVEVRPVGGGLDRFVAVVQLSTEMAPADLIFGESGADGGGRTTGWEQPAADEGYTL